MNAIATIAVGLSLFVPLEEGSPTQKEVRLLMGEWQVVHLDAGAGARLPMDAPQTVVQFTKDQILATNGDRRENPSPYTIDPSKSPKQLDMKEANRKEWRGIYKFEKGMLILCVSDKSRPSDFKGDLKTGTILYQLKRLEKK